MTWPLVTRAFHEAVERQLNAIIVSAHADYNRVVADYNELEKAWSARHDALLEKYHALKLLGATAIPPAEPIEFDEPDQPPDEVLAAMQAISPVRDKTYDANWLHWERNKDRAKQYPKEFADEILLGSVADDLPRH